jgi:hypothetical protein
MSWHVTGQSMEFCSCKMFCPCWLGPGGDPDEGWCGGAFGFEVEQGSSDGVDLSGTKLALTALWPGNFFAGDGQARLYIDESASDDQRRELDAIFTGKKGGHLEGLWAAVIKEWLPTQISKVAISWADTTSLVVDGIGQATLQPISDGAGHATTVTGAAAQAGLQIESMNLASSKGSTWADPDLREWHGDSGTLHRFDWRS